MTSTADYSTWLTKQQAADAIGVTTKTVERFVQAGQIQQARWQREGRGPQLAVYHPDDVARLASERKPGPLPPFVVPTSNGSANGNGHGAVTQVESKLESPRIHLTSGDDLLHALTLLMSKVMSETSQTPTLFLTLPEASAVSGLTQAYLRRACESGTLKAIKDRGWRIRRKDLEQL
jgi:hypothetical protein